MQPDDTRTVISRTNADYEEWLAEVVELVEHLHGIDTGIKQEIERDDRWFLESYFSYAAAHHAIDDYMQRRQDEAASGNERE